MNSQRSYTLSKKKIYIYIYIYIILMKLAIWEIEKVLRENFYISMYRIEKKNRVFNLGIVAWDIMLDFSPLIQALCLVPGSAYYF